MKWSAASGRSGGGKAVAIQADVSEEAEEVAEAVLWLASGKSSYSTGIFIDVTGGR